MVKFALAALAVVVVMHSAPPALAVESGRFVGCRERCDQQRSACQASPAYCEQRRKACLAHCD